MDAEFNNETLFSTQNLTLNPILPHLGSILQEHPYLFGMKMDVGRHEIMN